MTVTFPPISHTLPLSTRAPTGALLERSRTGIYHSTRQLSFYVNRGCTAATRETPCPRHAHGPRLSGTMVLYVYSIFKLTKVVYKNGITTFIPLLIVFCCCFDCSLRPIPGDGEHCTAPGTAEPPQEPSILRHDVSHLRAPHTRSPAVRVRALAAARGRALLSRVVVDGKTANHHRSARAAGTAFGLRPPRNHGTRPRMLVREPRPHEE